MHILTDTKSNNKMTKQDAKEWKKTIVQGETDWQAGIDNNNRNGYEKHTFIKELFKKIRDAKKWDRELNKDKSESDFQN